MRCQLRELLPAWLVSILLPLPAMLFWHSHYGRCVALWCFLLGCASLVAYAFRQGIGSQEPACSWRDRMLAVGTALLASWAVISLLWLAIVDRHDFVAVFIAFQIIIPSFCIVPFMMLVTRRPFPAVVFSLALLGCMKLVAGIVVNFVYGWGDGHHEIPWTNPNLMLSAFWIAAAILSAACYLLGARKYRAL